MIGAIRRRFENPVERDPWATDLEFAPEAEESTELATDATAFLATRTAAPGFYPGDSDPADYYRGVVKTALANGGMYGDHRIPIPWLRMILAGLESRPMDPNTMWYEIDAGETGVLADIPSYADLFPSERGVPVGPR